MAESEEEILAGASQGFRRKLRKAMKNGIEILAETSDEAIKEFCRLENYTLRDKSMWHFLESF